MTKNLSSLSLSLLFVHACNHDVSVIRRDDDGDGYYGEDCDDHDINVNPGAEEVCDGVDNDCDGEVDEGCPLIPL